MNIKSVVILGVGILSATLALSACHSNSTGTIGGLSVGGTSAGGTAGSPNTGGTIGGAGTGGTVGDPSSGNPGPGSTVGNPGSSGTAGAPGSGGTVGGSGSIGGSTSGSGSPVSAPKHVLTWGYDGDNIGGETDGTDKLSLDSTNAASRAHVQQWLSFVEGTRKAEADCPPGGACTPILYFSPGVVESGCSGIDQSFVKAMSDDESAFFHTATPISPSNRIQTSATAWGCTTPHTSLYFPNGADATMQKFWAGQALKYPNNMGGMSDNTTGGCRVGGYSAKPVLPVEFAGKCGKQKAVAFAALYKAMKHPDGTQWPIFFNGIVPDSASRVTLDLDVLQEPNVVGAIGEGALIGSGLGYGHGSITIRSISSLLDTISIIDTTTTKKYVLLSYLAAGAPGPCVAKEHAWIVYCSETQQRRLALGLLWLGFKDGQSVLWDDPGQALVTSIGVYPEASLYPTRPLQTMTSFHCAAPKTGYYGDESCTNPQCATSGGGSADLQVACGKLSDGTPGGVFRREFAACYNFGVPIGPCAVVLNTTNSPVVVQSSWLHQTYGHSLKLTNGDVLAAGCDNGPCPKSALDPAGASFTAGKTTVGSTDAIFLFQ